jgi:fructose-1,6-bisphosphatase/inositol monophosphatase family enzyme
MPSLSELLEVAVEAAYLGGRRTLAHFGTGVAVETKADLSPVTVADRESEAAIRGAHRPLLPDPPGPRRGGGARGGRRRGLPLVVDPLDGTKTFVRGVPLYGVLVGVEVDGEARAGACTCRPSTRCSRPPPGSAAASTARSVRASPVSRLEEATVLVTDEASARARSGAYAALSGRAKFVRSWGDCYGYVLVAPGGPSHARPRHEPLGLRAPVADPGGGGGRSPPGPGSAPSTGRTLWARTASSTARCSSCYGAADPSTGEAPL